jgi:transposase
MSTSDLYQERKSAIHLLRSGCSPKEVAAELNRSIVWVCQWQERFEKNGWAGLESQSRAPKEHGRKLSPKIQQAIIQARSELEAEATEGEGLKYMGSPAVLARLKRKKIAPLPSLARIERVLRAGGMTRTKKSTEAEIKYPPWQPNQPHPLIQVDIVPHYLRGGERVAGFNGLDVVWRYPTGQAFAQRRAEDAKQFLLHVWQQIGLSGYTQVDNEGCFSGGFTHQAVLGQVVRSALWVGTELVFSPIRHPESNCFVERFHQDYDDHIWHNTTLQNIADVNQRSTTFFQNYRQSEHHSALNGQSPAEVHFQRHPQLLPPDFELPEGKIPLTEGQIHFMRRVSDAGTVSVLNLEWAVPHDPDPPKAVWVTLQFALTGATLRIYDAAPDVDARVCLVAYPFPVSETIHPKLTSMQPSQPNKSQGEYLMQLPLEFFTISARSTAKMVAEFLAMY